MTCRSSTRPTAFRRCRRAWAIYLTRSRAVRVRDVRQVLADTVRRGDVAYFECAPSCRGGDRGAGAVNRGGARTARGTAKCWLGGHRACTRRGRRPKRGDAFARLCPAATSRPDDDAAWIKLPGASRATTSSEPRIRRARRRSSLSLGRAGVDDSGREAVCDIRRDPVNGDALRDPRRS